MDTFSARFPFDPNFPSPPCGFMNNMYFANPRVGAMFLQVEGSAFVQQEAESEEKGDGVGVSGHIQGFTIRTNDCSDRKCLKHRNCWWKWTSYEIVHGWGTIF